MGHGSLNADDTWDRMAAERDRPLPIMENEQEHDDSLSLTESLSGGDDLVNSWTDEEIAESRMTLGGAKSAYERFETAFSGPLSDLSQQGLSENDRNIAWRTTQLHLSRLINLHNGIERAMRTLSHNRGDLASKDDALLGESQNILGEIKRKISLVKNDLIKE